MNPYAKFLNPYAKNIVYMEQDIHKRYYAESAGHMYLGSGISSEKMILNYYKFILLHEEDRAERAAARKKDKRDPLIKDPHSEPRSRTHLLMVAMPGGQHRRPKSCRKKLDLLMG